MQEKVSFRRMLVPIGLILGSLLCAFIAFTAGVRDELPQPQGAVKTLLATNQQVTVFEQWKETANIKIGTAELFTIRQTITEAANFYRQAYVERRGWKENPPPDPPRDKAANQQFTLLAFSKDNNSVIIALTTGAGVNEVDNIFQRVLKTANPQANTTLVLVANWFVRT
jgi:hypothetical protein